MNTVGCLYRTLYKNNCIRKMTSNFSYKDAILKLNSLQSNKAYLDYVSNIHASNNNSSVFIISSIHRMEQYLTRVGIKQSDLDKLSVIHVAGTKGKGSTCAMCESILRHHGYTTGFFTSPHLVSACERIRLNGNMISEESFAKYFHKIYTTLENTKTHEEDMPSYFGITAVLAFYIFLEEKVDVAIIEVGIGGNKDFTNVLKKVPVVGITSLGIDHTLVLGNTIEEIAEAKAGIMKPGCRAFTVKQPPRAMQVLRRVAEEVNCPLQVVPDFRTYSIPELNNKTKYEINIYNLNASLAIQLSHAWMQKCDTNRTISEENLIAMTNCVNNNSNNTNDSLVTALPQKTILGLQNLDWQGRYQFIDSDFAYIYLDGAHTKESMEICAAWFKDVTSQRPSDKILIFSLTGDRNGEEILTPLKNIKFQKVYFVKPIAYKETDEKNDNYYKEGDKDTNFEKCKNNAAIWNKLSDETCVHVMECVSDALLDIKRLNTKSQLLITGSLHLVGASLSILNSELR